MCVYFTRINNIRFYISIERTWTSYSEYVELRQNRRKCSRFCMVQLFLKYFSKTDVCEKLRVLSFNHTFIVHFDLFTFISFVLLTFLLVLPIGFFRTNRLAWISRFNYVLFDLSSILRENSKTIKRDFVKLMELDEHIK